MQQQVAGAPHRAHAAATEPGLQLEAAVDDPSVGVPVAHGEEHKVRETRLRTLAGLRQSAAPNQDADLELAVGARDFGPAQTETTGDNTTRGTERSSPPQRLSSAPVAVKAG
ncbi:hypothetical protein GCM10010276_37450 [Streptomyces longisporus]|uniref:Uncharacterized protein n=1 Tax=Streptomyces longisporus TaxID=1948 RepID=A0ABP5Z7H3_STRLO